MTQNPQRIVALKAENFKRLQAVEISPEENTVVLSGKNAQGKSSVLDSIWWALGGGAAGKKITNPIRNGATKAVAEVTLDDFVVTRSASVDKKTSTLTVTKRDGTKVSSPQKVLDEMIGKLTFDPLEFTRLATKEQREYLLNAVDIGIDLDEWDTERNQAFTERTDVNRSVKNLQAQVDGIVIPEGTPEHVDTAALIAELNTAQTASHNLMVAETAVDGWSGKIERLTRELEEAHAEKHVAEGQVLAAEQSLKKCRPVDDIQTDIAGASEANKAGEMIREKERLSKMLSEADAEATALTDKITAMDKNKADLLTAAEMPIEGLGIDGDTVTYQGQPLAQASSAEQTKVALAITVALNPTLRIAYIRDGSLLDSESMEIVRAIAEQCDFQVWVELVSEDGDTGILIEDGQISDGLW